MNFNPITLADSATQTTANGPQSMILMIVWLVVIFGAMYFIMIRPQRKKQKEEKKMRDNLQVGDEIVTIGGIYGRVISLKEDTIVIMRMRFLFMQKARLLIAFCGQEPGLIRSDW